jgi:outer membrane protein
MKEYHEMKSYQEKLNKQEQEFRAKYENINAEFQKEYIAFEEKAKKERISQKKYEQAIAGFRQKGNQLQQMQQSDSYKQQQESQVILTGIVDKVEAFVKDYGKKNGYTFILGTNENTGTVLYAEETLDITDTVLEALNNSKEEAETTSEEVVTPKEEKKEIEAPKEN